MAIRLVPMSKQDPDMKGKTILEIQKNFFDGHLKKHAGSFAFKTAINANDGDLFLFQLEGKVIASAELDKKIKKPVKDVNGYTGEYYFKSETVKIFNPISADELRQYCKDFKGFNRSPQYLEVISVSALEKRINSTLIEERAKYKEGVINKKALIKYKKYTRGDIHDVFDPQTKFTVGAGKWGTTGIVSVPNTISDYVFLVNQSIQTFDENIDENGILTWGCRSRVKNPLNDKRINDFINHDHNKSNIYLFFREENQKDYYYLGNIAYLSHIINNDNRTVIFKWQILDWGLNKGNNLLDKKTVNEKASKKVNGVKINIDDVNPKDFICTNIDIKKSYVKVINAKGKVNSRNKVNNNIDFEEETERNSKLGSKGEDFVVEFEKKRLLEVGEKELAQLVKPTREFLGKAAKYDVLSFEEDGTEKHIEVKTTIGSVSNPFFISENEVAFSREEPNYYLYRVYDFNIETMTTKIAIIPGPIDEQFLVPIKYKCSICNKDEK